MPTPRDAARTAAFRKWIAHIGGREAAARDTGIALRSIERMAGGKQPPPAKLLEDLAGQLAAKGGADALADELAIAARPQEKVNA
ncbi:hypothetical protein [Sphingomonas alpina]|uniref:XRE family transcriptional regulator n=1 Tax=Sphingomonas alpina TaxID=653931 RepID=A0A7H0LHZ0_9SPHN|nr:hypothetical protein [Sphingomonas alpina]QNQ09293.1 hypothetical protein H3Z74_21905 [Sphingomonas alpina]